MKKGLDISSLSIFIFFNEYLLNVHYVLDTRDKEHGTQKEWERDYVSIYTLFSVREDRPASSNSYALLTHTTMAPICHVTESTMVNSARL